MADLFGFYGIMLLMIFCFGVLTIPDPDAKVRRQAKALKEKR